LLLLLFFSLSAAAETEQQQLERDWKGRKKGGGNDCFLPFSSTLACTLRPLEREKGEEKGIDRRFLPLSSTMPSMVTWAQPVDVEEKGKKGKTTSREVLPIRICSFFR